MIEAEGNLSSKINAFLLSENRLFREALARILRSKSDICVVGVAPYSPEVIEQIEAARCDVLLVDPGAGEPLDMGLIQEVRLAAGDAKIVLIDMVEDESAFLKAVRAGVSGYILQEASALDVVAAVRSVKQGEAVCPSRLCLCLFKYLANKCPNLPNSRIKAQLGLTRREQQLLPLIAQGMTNKEIASQLNLSEQTIKNHVHRILQRTGASGRLEVVEAVRANGVAL
jgi:two-component system NarL family response regulator